jgi:hypothetical protein
MLIYHPPKAQVWGHRLGRLKTMQLFDRSERFVHEQMIVQPPQTANFTVNWMAARSPEISLSIDSFRDSITSHARRGTCSNQFGQQVQTLTWRLSGDEMRSAAMWLETMRSQHDDPDEFSATLSSMITFQWRNVPPGEDTPPCGGMYGLHLPQPGALTTMFSFVSTSHYQTIKGDLKKTELVVLSDKHLRPAARPKA